MESNELDDSIGAPTLGALKPNPKNPRKNSKAKLAALAKSLAEFGDLSGIVVNRRSGLIVGGHQRREVLPALTRIVLERRFAQATKAGTVATGYAEIDGERFAYREVDFDPAREKAANIAANKGAGEWDQALLGEWFKELNDLKFDLDLTMFDESERAGFLGAGGKEGLTDPDAIPENVETRCKPGDLWQLGEHRLLCGDSTKREDVERLMGGEKAGLCFTSPPYAQQRDYGVGKVSDWDELLNGVFNIVPLADDGQILVNLGLVHRDNEWVPYWDRWLEHMRSIGWRRFGLYVWDQGPGLPGNWNGRLAPSFELVFHFNREARQPDKWIDKKPESIAEKRGTGLRRADGTMSGVSNPAAGLQPTKIPDSVIRVNRQATERLGHPAAYPVALPEFAINTYVVDAFYEPFCGSGSALIACEKTNRRCFGMEIDPHYCDVILKRWEDFTGLEAVKLGR